MGAGGSATSMISENLGSKARGAEAAPRVPDGAKAKARHSAPQNPGSNTEPEPSSLLFFSGGGVSATEIRCLGLGRSKFMELNNLTLPTHRFSVHALTGGLCLTLSTRAK